MLPSFFKKMHWPSQNFFTFCELHLASVAPNFLPMTSGVAIGWTGWTKYGGPPSAGGPRVGETKKKQFVITTPAVGGRPDVDTRWFLNDNLLPSVGLARLAYTYSNFSFQTLCSSCLIQNWKPKPKIFKCRTLLIWEKILFQKSDHSVANSAKKSRTVSRWEMFWLYYYHLMFCRQCRNLKLRVFSSVHCQSRSHLKRGTQLLETETDKILLTLINCTRSSWQFGAHQHWERSSQAAWLRGTRWQICKH